MRQRISAVMDWAIAMQFRTDNPCERLGPVLGPQQDLVQHMRALPHAEVAGAIRSMWGSGATEAVKLAFEFLVLTAARSGEVRGARWAEIDKSAHVWTIPATRKLGDGRSRLVFPSRGGKPISITRLPRMLQNLKIAAVPHGFRSSFRDWAAETTDHRREVIEAALAHAVANQTEAAYARSDLFERRRHLRDEWAEYLDGTRLSEDPPLYILPTRASAFSAMLVHQFQRARNVAASVP